MNSIILEARGLTKEYKQTIALDHINLQIVTIQNHPYSKMKLG